MYGLLAEEAAKRPAVLVLDEFQAITRYGDYLPSLFKALADAHPRVSLVLAGSKRHLMEELVIHNQAPLFGMAQRLSLGPIPPAEMEAFLRQRAAGAGKPFEDTAAAHLLDLAGPVPNDIQHLAFEAYEAARRRHRHPGRRPRHGPGRRPRQRAVRREPGPALARPGPGPGRHRPGSPDRAVLRGLRPDRPGWPAAARSARPSSPSCKTRMSSSATAGSRSPTPSSRPGCAAPETGSSRWRLADRGPTGGRLAGPADTGQEPPAAGPVHVKRRALSHRGAEHFSPRLTPLPRLSPPAGSDDRRRR